MTTPRELSARFRDDADRMEKYGPSPVAAALRAVADLVDEMLGGPGAATFKRVALPGNGGDTWRERLWIVPDQTRLGVREVAEALGRSIDFVYRHTGPSTSSRRIPHQKIDGALAFIAADVRDWLRQAEGAISSPVHVLSRRRGARAQRETRLAAWRDGKTVPPQL